MTDASHTLTAVYHRLGAIGATFARALHGRSASSARPAHAGRRRSGVGRLWLMVSVAALAFVSLPATALAVTHDFKSSFGPDGTSGTRFASPQAVAVDQATGDVYVVDAGAGNVQRSDASGHDPASVDFTAGAGMGTNVLGPFSFDSGGSATEVAVDNSGGPTDGDIYVASFAGVDIFSAAGAHLGSLTGSTVPGGAYAEACGVAVAPNGDVYVGDFGGSVDRYVPDGTSNPVTDARYDSQIAGVSSPCNVTASDANVYASTWPSGPLTAYPASLFPGSAGSPGSVNAGSSGIVIDRTSTAVSVDPATADVYVDEGGLVSQFNSGGTLLGTFGSGHLTGSAGVAVSGLTNFAYAADAGSEQVEVYGAGYTPAPSVSNDVMFNLTEAETTVRGDLNNFNTQLTDCHFEYGTTTDYGTSVPCSSVPTPGSDPVVVSAHLSGLTPGTTYQYRLDATSAGGATRGPDGTFTTPNPSSTACPNNALRKGPSARLPDCRAYEQVSAVNKNGNDVIDDGTQIRLATNGEAVTYTSYGNFADARSSGFTVPYMATRGANWTTHSLLPPGLHPLNPELISARLEPSYEQVTPDLSTGVFLSASPVTADSATANIPNYYLRDDLATPGAGSYRLETACPGCTLPLPAAPDTRSLESLRPFLDGISADGEHVVFTSQEDLTADAPGDCAAANLDDFTICPPKLYDAHDGTVSLVGVLPDGSVAFGADAGQGPDLAGVSKQLNTPDVVSQDGSRIIFKDQPVFGDITFANLYDRINDASTVQINASEKTNGTGPGGTDPSGPQPAEYWDASRDGTRVFFSSQEALTSDAADISDQQLYMWDASAPAGHRLTLIHGDVNAPDANSNLSAEGGVLGASPDGHYLYFAARGRWTANQPRLSDSDLALYVWHDGVVRFIAPLGASDHYGDYINDEFGLAPQARVTPDGHGLLFTTGGVDGVGPTGHAQGAYSELYLYSFDNASLTCVSCNPSGAPSTATALDMDLPNSAGSVSNDLNHPLTANGRFVFFTTAEKLVPQDANGVEDAYEFDAYSGQLHLLSTGQSPDGSFFEDATPDGSSAVILSREQLVGQDTDQAYDAYAVQIGGGIGAQNPAGASPPCSDPQSCQGSSSLSSGLSPAGSATFIGPANPSSTAAMRLVHIRMVLVHLSFKEGSVALIVDVPGKGRLTATSNDTKPLSRALSQRGRYRVALALTSPARKGLKRSHRLKLRIRLTFAPSGGQASSTIAWLAVNR